MRIPKYLSPSSISLAENDMSEFYLKYLAENRPEKFPQTRPMSAGSAFDAYVKAFIHKRLFACEGEFGFEALFLKQVEPHNRDWAKPVGQEYMDAYVRSGALTRLMGELNVAVGKPRMEFDVINTINGVPFLGKPDLFFISNEGASCIYDWKVNGANAETKVSPKPGYVVCRDGWTGDAAKPSRRNGLQHPDCMLAKFKGIIVNVNKYMEDVDVKWADQLSVYSWLLGEPVGNENLVLGIDQLCGKRGTVRVASHRARCSEGHQTRLMDRAATLWETIQSGWIFRKLSQERSLTYQADLDTLAAKLTQDDDLSQFMQSMRAAPKMFK